jgi:heterotetrameric sarcosine oxidase gamma subunit
VLAKGRGLDLHPCVFPEGACARTRFAQIPVALDHRGADQFELYVGWSYLAYLQGWVMDAAVEFKS